MEIRQFRVVLRARDYELTCRFYGEIMALPRLQSWARDDGRGALFHAGTGIIEVLGRPRDADPRLRDEDFDYQGPDHKMTLALVVRSAAKTYEEMLFRDRNIRGGLERRADGTVAFVAHDPDGVRILFLELGR